MEKSLLFFFLRAEKSNASAISTLGPSLDRELCPHSLAHSWPRHFVSASRSSRSCAPLHMRLPLIPAHCPPPSEMPLSENPNSTFPGFPGAPGFLLFSPHMQPLRRLSRSLHMRTLFFHILRSFGVQHELDKANCGRNKAGVPFFWLVPPIFRGPLPRFLLVPLANFHQAPVSSDSGVSGCSCLLMHLLPGSDHVAIALMTYKRTFF